MVLKLFQIFDTDEKVPENESTRSNHSPPIWLFWRAKRYVVTLMVFLGLINTYLLRVNLSVAIVAMTQYYNVTLPNGTIEQVRDFDWDSKVQGYLLSSFFYGYVFTQLIGAYLGIKYGGRIIIATGIGLASILTLLTPVVAQVNVYLFIIVRILEGLFEGFIVPSTLILWRNWAPPLERCRLLTISISGTYLGTVICLPMSSALASKFGWESIFYVTGACGCLWCLFWLLLVVDSPSDDKTISKEELHYITSSLQETRMENNTKVPIWSILTSVPAWGLHIAVSCELWGFYTLLTQIPKFMKYILKFDLSSSGLVSALPYLSVTVMVQLAGRLSDYIQAKNKLSNSFIRKSFVAFGFGIQFLFIIISIYWLSPVTTTLCLTVALGFGGFSMAGFSVNSLDLSPQFAGIIVGLSNTIATLPGIVSPILTGYIVTDEENVDQWRIVFCIAGCVYLFGAILYCSIGSGELQPWDQSKESPERE
ncbi:sialin-like [Diorhabda carinulata]|uniref:sialin-like n=1 Tax=Diorhabda carinulata TaxID=1163345 RepID=UPI0025A2268E|nr:sialin-like [Diorhabda carinulata]